MVIVIGVWPCGSVAFLLACLASLVVCINHAKSFEFIRVILVIGEEFLDFCFIGDGRIKVGRHCLKQFIGVLLCGLRNMTFSLEHSKHGLCFPFDVIVQIYATVRDQFHVAPQVGSSPSLPWHVRVVCIRFDGFNARRQIEGYSQNQTETVLKTGGVVGRTAHFALLCFFMVMVKYIFHSVVLDNTVAQAVVFSAQNKHKRNLRYAQPRMDKDLLVETLGHVLSLFKITLFICFPPFFCLVVGRESGRDLGSFGL
jgi:hypothetical protein